MTTLRRPVAIRPPARSADGSARLLGVLAACVVLAASAACGNDPSAPADVDVEEEEEDQLTPTDLIRLSWIGPYVGSGKGIVGYDLVEVDSARLSFQIDADSLRPADCPLCMTVTLDTLFSLVNVRIDDAMQLDLQYIRDGKQWRLSVWRGSAATASTASAHLLARPVDGGPTWVRMTYSMERP